MLVVLVLLASGPEGSVAMASKPDVSFAYGAAQYFALLHDTWTSTVTTLLRGKSPHLDWLRLVEPIVPI